MTTERSSTLSSPTLGIDVPAATFGDFALPDALVEVLASQGITTPLPIQAMTIADALAGRDVSAKAPTGSGKTLAFALPVAATVRHCAPKKPQALILVPTRELALQISDVLAPLLRARGRHVAVVYGGVSYERQRKAMRNGADVVVACPGRLEDLMQAGHDPVVRGEDGRSRRGRPHGGHGLLAGRASDPRCHGAAPPDFVVLGDARRRCRRPRAPVPEGPGPA